MGAFFTMILMRRLVRAWQLRGEEDESALDVDAGMSQGGRGIRGRLLGAIGVLVALSFAAWVASLLLARRLTSGDESTDE